MFKSSEKNLKTPYFPPKKDEEVMESLLSELNSVKDQIPNNDRISKIKSAIEKTYKQDKIEESKSDDALCFRYLYLLKVSEILTDIHCEKPSKEDFNKILGNFDKDLATKSDKKIFLTWLLMVEANMPDQPVDEKTLSKMMNIIESGMTEKENRAYSNYVSEAENSIKSSDTREQIKSSGNVLGK